MAYNRSRRGYNSNRGNRQQQQRPVSFACPRKFYSLCSHRLGEGVGLVGIFDKLNPEDNIEQGNIELLCLEKLHDIIADIPDNNEETLNTKVRIFVPDMLSYLINGDVADFMQNGVRINGDEIDEDLLELIDSVDTMLREKSRNVNIRLYQYQPNDLKSESQDWFQELVDSYLNGLANANNSTAKTESKRKSLEDQLAEALANNDMPKAEMIMEFQRQQVALSKSQNAASSDAEEEAQA